MSPVSALGWLATAVFCASYLFRRSSTLRKVQAAAACLWILYGVSIGAMPVIVANLIVAGAALYSSFRVAGGASVAVPVTAVVVRSDAAELK